MTLAGPVWIERRNAPISPSTPEVDPFEADATFSWHAAPNSAQIRESIWPSDGSQAALRWARQTADSMMRSAARTVVDDPDSVLDVLEEENPFVLEPQRHHDICAPCFDESGRRVIWPWETYSSGPMFMRMRHLPPHRSDALVLSALMNATADGQMGRTTTGVRAWFTFCDNERISPLRALDPQASLQDKLLEEELCMRFCATIVGDRGVAPKTAAQYLSQVQGWHARSQGVKLCAGLSMKRLPQMLKGLRRLMGETPRAVRRGIAPQALRTAFDRVLDPTDPVHANIRAALALALQGLLRSAEFATETSQKFNSSRSMTRADVRVLTAKRLVVMMLPCKNMRHLNGKTVPLAIGAGGELIDAVWEMNNLMRVDPTPFGMEESTPLFRTPRNNEPLRTDFLRDITRQLMRSIGEEADDFNLHSYRIGGATALFAAGADPTVIRTMGRWSSDCYRLYVRACFEATLKWTKVCGSTKVSDVAGEFAEVDFY